jgi:DNA-binding transcriptional ArsR family regulator
LRRDVFQAIADPTRRAIIDIVAGQSLTLNAVAEKFDISRPAISKHVKILTECGLIVINQQGRERFCEANLKQLKQVADWTDQFHAFWSQKLDALGAFLERTESKPSSAKRSSTSKNKRK